MNDARERKGRAWNNKMSYLRLVTERLELTAGSLALSQAELQDRTRFHELLNAQVVEWPPRGCDEQAMTSMRDYFAENPNDSGWGAWYFILRGSNEEERVLIGNGGFKGSPSSDGSVEVGYSIVDRFQRKGYATEAVQSLVAWAFDYQEVRRVLAEALPENTPSIRVLEKNGFRYIGQGSEEGVIRYEITREDFIQRTGRLDAVVTTPLAGGRRQV